MLKKIFSLLLVMALGYGLWQGWTYRNGLHTHQSIAQMGQEKDKQLQAMMPVNQQEQQVFQNTADLPSDPLSMAELYITKLYQTKDVALIPQIIELYLQAHQYEKALGFLQLLQQKGDITTQLPVEVIISTLLNGVDLNFKNIDTLKALVQKYYDQKLLSAEQFAAYDALITFTRGDHNNYSYFMDQIKGGKLQEWKISFQKLKEQFLSFPEAPSSYLDAMIAMDIFKRGYINVALVTAQRLFKQDPNYILPRQIMAYGFIFLGRRNEALEHLDFLIDKDPENKQVYLFFKGVAFFQTGKYQEALLVFQQINAAEFKDDILKYQVLIYSKLKDRLKLQETVKQLTATPLTAQEYIGMFQPLLYASGQVMTTGGVSEELRKPVAELLRKCYTELPTEQSFACLYGKAGVMVAQGETEQSYNYLRQLVVAYPQDYLYEALGRVVETQGNMLQAQKFYSRALTLKRDGGEKTALQEKVMQMVK